MKIALTLIMFFSTVFVAADAYRTYNSIQQDKDNKARYQQQKEDRNTAMAKACAAGKTGVVLYWNGVNCANNVK